MRTAACTTPCCSSLVTAGSSPLQFLLKGVHSVEHMVRPPNGCCSVSTHTTHTSRPQVWNHTFFWESMKANGGGAPTGKLADAINASFGSLDEFKVRLAGRSSALATAAATAGVQKCPRNAAATHLGCCPRCCARG